jgi:hypothetical protein
LGVLSLNNFIATLFASPAKISRKKFGRKTHSLKAAPPYISKEKGAAPIEIGTALGLTNPRNHC